MSTLEAISALSALADRKCLGSCTPDEVIWPHESMLAAALSYAARGWEVFPADASGAKKSHKAAEYSGGRAWGKTTDAAEIIRDFAKWQRANIGLPTGAGSGFFVVEADTPEGHNVEGIGSLRALEAAHGSLPHTLMAESPSGSLHYYFKWPPGIIIRNSTSKIADGVDVKGEGGMVLAPPSVRPGKGLYRWLNDLPIADAPDWLIEICAAGDSSEQRVPGEPQADLTRVARALAVIPNNDVDWESWNNIGMATWAATGGAGFDIFSRWSEKSAKHDADETRRRWDGYVKSPPTKIGAGTIFHMANEAQPGWDDPPDVSIKGLGAWDAGNDVEPPPPRGWLLGNSFCRKFMSSLLGDGGVGKTAYRYAQMLSLASGRVITGEHVFQRCRVLVISLEDDTDELRRRILAARLHHRIALEDIKGWLFLSAPGGSAGKLMTTDQRGRGVRGRLADNIVAEIVAHRIDLVVIDPFVKSHSVEENHNSIIDDVAQILTDIAVRHNIAVDAPHHTSKGGADPGNADKGRGASAMKDAARLVYTLTPMSPEEAKTLGINQEDRKQFVRVDSGKVNITKTLGAAKWFRLVGVRIGNATEMYPHGDEVQTVEPWTPPDTWEGISDLQIDQIIADIDAGLPGGNRYTDAPNAADRAAWKVVVKHAQGKTEGQAREIIRAWVKGGRLVARDYPHPATRKTVKGLWKGDDEIPF